MPEELTWRAAITKVLETAKTSLHYTEIAETIQTDGLRQHFGATPAATVNAQISSSIKHEGQQSPYVRVEKGVFALKSLIDGTSAPTSDTDPGQASESSNEEETQYDVVRAFGMFWRRNDVRWTATPKLLGKQGEKATAVDFSGQRGIYLLYDGREVIYVGRVTDSSFGKRLYQHTSDRFAARWDRFSWFGLLPVSEAGKLSEQPATYDASKIIPTLEAVLIEALEPRQNRKQGDGLKGVEFTQKEDPEIHKWRMKNSLAELLEKA